MRQTPKDIACPWCGAHPTEDCIDMRGGGGGGMDEYGTGNAAVGTPGHRRIKSIHPERRMALEDMAEADER